MVHVCHPSWGRWEQVNQEFKFILAYRKPCLKKSKQNKVKHQQQQHQKTNETYGDPRDRMGYMEQDPIFYGVLGHFISQIPEVSDTGCLVSTLQVGK